MKKIILVITLFISCYSLSNSQSISVVAGLKEDGAVYIRWFSNSTFNVEGVNVYKRTVSDNNWAKLNSLPIKRAEDVSKSTSDSTLKYYSILTYNKPQDPDDEGTWRLAVLAQGIFDSDFADFYGMQFIDKEVETGKTYEYKVIKITNGTEGEGSISNQIKIGSYIKPDAPNGFSHNDGDGFVNFKWNHDKKKFFAYNIYRSESPGGNRTLINENAIFVFNFRNAQGQSVTAEDFYTDTSVINGKTYFYELCGIDFLGRESKPSQQIKALPRDIVPPSAAYNVKTIIKSDSVIVSWQIEKDKDLKEINILRSNDFNGPFTKLNKSPLSQDALNYTDIIKNPEPAYYYVVESVDFSGNVNNSFPSFTIIPDLEPPSTPKDLTAIGEVGRVILQWKNNLEKDLAGYFIWRSLSGEEDDFLLLTTEPYVSNKYIDSLNKEISNVITYRIKALDKSFNESDYSKTVNVRMKDVTPPEKPLLVSVINDSSTVKISWIKNSEPDLIGYNVFISSGENQKAFRKLNEKPIQSEFYENEIKISGDYKFYINAIDSSGNFSENSDTLECSVILEENSVNQLKIISAIYNNEKNAAIISWNKLQDVAGYIVYRRDKDDDLAESISELIQQNTFEDNASEKDKYFYSVRAFDNQGNVFISEEISP